MKIYTKTVYECAYCGKISKNAGGMGNHEHRCRKNPNIRPRCFDCKHYEGIISDTDKIDFLWYRNVFFEEERLRKMTPVFCKIDNKRMFNHFGVKYEELEIALLDADWKLMPTIAEGCPNYEPF